MVIIYRAEFWALEKKKKKKKNDIDGSWPLKALPYT